MFIYYDFIYLLLIPCKTWTLIQVYEILVIHSYISINQISVMIEVFYYTYVIIALCEVLHTISVLFIFCSV